MARPPRTWAAPVLAVWWACGCSSNPVEADALDADTALVDGGMTGDTSTGPDDAGAAPLTDASADISYEASDEASDEDSDEGAPDSSTSPWCHSVGDDDLLAQTALFDPRAVMDVDIGLAATAMQALRTAPFEYVEGTLSIDGGAAQPVGVRLKGGGDGDPANGSFQPLDDKPSFKIDVNRVVDCAHLHGLEKLTFNSMLQDPSRLHEWLGYRLFSLVGVPAPRIGWVSLRLNDQDYGLYLNVEAYDQRAFLDREFESTGHLYEEDLQSDFTLAGFGGFEVDRGDPDDLGDLLAAATVLAGHAPEEDLRAATAHAFDWDRIVAFLATERFIDHWDGYSGQVHNYLAHSNATGRFTLLPWGLDMAFRDSTEDLHAGGGVVFDVCLADAGCRAAFDAVLADLRALLADQEIATEVQAVAALLLAEVATDWRSPWTLDEHAAAAADLLDFIASREAGL